MAKTLSERIDAAILRLEQAIPRKNGPGLQMYEDLLALFRDIKRERPVVVVDSIRTAAEYLVNQQVERETQTCSTDAGAPPSPSASNAEGSTGSTSQAVPDTPSSDLDGGASSSPTQEAPQGSSTNTGSAPNTQR